MTSLPNAKPPGLGPGKSDSYTLPLSTTAPGYLPKDAVNPSLEALRQHLTAKDGGTADFA